MKKQIAKFSIFVVIAVMAASVVFAQDKKAAPAVSKGETLERQMWKDIKAKKWTDVKAKIATGFQSVHHDGNRDRAAELKLLESLKLGDYKLSKFSVTQSGNAWIVTYMLTVDETIGGKKMASAPSPRMSVWQKTEKGYQWIAHSNLNTPEPEAGAIPPAKP